MDANRDRRRPVGVADRSKRQRPVGRDAGLNAEQSVVVIADLEIDRLSRFRRRAGQDARGPAVDRFQAAVFGDGLVGTLRETGGLVDRRHRHENRLRVGQPALTVAGLDLDLVDVVEIVIRWVFKVRSGRERQHAGAGQAELVLIRAAELREAQRLSRQVGINGHDGQHGARVLANAGGRGGCDHRAVVVESVDSDRHRFLEQVAAVIDLQANREAGSQFAIHRFAHVEEELIANEREAAVVGRTRAGSQREREDVVEIGIDRRDRADQYRIRRVRVLVDARRSDRDVGRTAIDFLDAEIDAGAVLV